MYYKQANILFFLVLFFIAYNYKDLLVYNNRNDNLHIYTDNSLFTPLNDGNIIWLQSSYNYTNTLLLQTKYYKFDDRLLILLNTTNNVYARFLQTLYSKTKSNPKLNYTGLPMEYEYILAGNCRWIMRV